MFPSTANSPYRQSTCFDFPEELEDARRPAIYVSDYCKAGWIVPPEEITGLELAYEFGWSFRMHKISCSSFDALFDRE